MSLTHVVLGNSGAKLRSKTLSAIRMRKIRFNWSQALGTLLTLKMFVGFH